MNVDLDLVYIFSYIVCIAGQMLITECNSCNCRNWKTIATSDLMRLTVNLEVNYYPAMSRLQVSQKWEQYKETANNNISEKQKNRTWLINDLLCVCQFWVKMCIQRMKRKWCVLRTHSKLCIIQMLTAIIALYSKTHSSEWSIYFSFILSDDSLHLNDSV